ncbi:transforming growth factor-beta-induced protein ig-h3-like [Elysia marginata]|uniref:Transforming growth factor-beta-induced protein ig-h3-like n=1 Tax=Elysia marginata TaxID=1093978 RepID=A0AAV4IBU8_9GAST|nr:transforming growth factor-beta-induced protein ig-h3-like [Elysia marginata]
MSPYIKNDVLLDTYLTGSKLRTNVYNMGQGKRILAQGSHVTKADLLASNGIVHVIDRVIYPVPSLSIPLILTFDKDLNNLGYLVYQANLISKFSEQSFTFFAPSNEAIAKIPAQEYNNLLMNFTELTCTVYSGALSDGQKLKSLQGETLQIETNSAGM